MQRYDLFSTRQLLVESFLYSEAGWEVLFTLIASEAALFPEYLLYASV